MIRQPATTTPTEPGYYVVWFLFSERPVVLYWSRLSTQWRDGMRAVAVDGWMGPL